MSIELAKLQQLDNTLSEIKKSQEKSYIDFSDLVLINTDSLVYKGTVNYLLNGFSVIGASSTNLIFSTTNQLSFGSLIFIPSVPLTFDLEFYVDGNLVGSKNINLSNTNKHFLSLGIMNELIYKEIYSPSTWSFWDNTLNDYVLNDNSSYTYYVFNTGVIGGEQYRFHIYRTMHALSAFKRNGYPYLKYPNLEIYIKNVSGTSTDTLTISLEGQN